MAQYTKKDLQNRLTEVYSVYKDPSTSEETRQRAKQMVITIRDALSQQQYAETPAPEAVKQTAKGMKGDIQQSWKSGEKAVHKTLDDYVGGEIGETEATIQLLGKSAGSILNVTADLMSPLMPDELPAWMPKVTQWAMGTDTAKWITEEWDSLGEQTQKTVESLTNLFMMGSPRIKGGKLMQQMETKGRLIKKGRLADYFVDPKADTVKGKVELVKRLLTNID